MTGSEVLLIMVLFCNGDTCQNSNVFDAPVLTLEDCAVKPGTWHVQEYSDPDSGKVLFGVRHVPCRKWLEYK